MKTELITTTNEVALKAKVSNLLEEGWNVEAMTSHNSQQDNSTEYAVLLSKAN